MKLLIAMILSAIFTILSMNAHADVAKDETLLHHTGQGASIEVRQAITLPPSPEQRYILQNGRKVKHVSAPGTPAIDQDGAGSKLVSKSPTPAQAITAGKARAL